jgi:manganese-dependent inorganic pyrophosphatase
VAAAIAYARYKNSVEKTDVYTPAIAEEINRETKYVLEKFSLPKPERLDNAKNKNIILVDHNEFSQAVDGIEEAKILEIVDHHKMDFKYGEPITITTRPWGSSCSIIYRIYQGRQIKIDKALAGLMLSAALVDTVITKSPTCTDRDVEIIHQLSRLAEVASWQEFGMEIFKVRSSVSELSPAEILKSDFKDFTTAQGKIGIGQVETVELKEIEPHEDEIMEVMSDLKKTAQYHSIILFITDIIKEGSKFLVVTEDESGFEEAMGAKPENGKVYIPGIISRKKQVAPKIMKVFDK